MSAVLSDFDLHDELCRQSARKTLDAIKAVALETKQTGFDPSGTAQLAGNTSTDLGSHSVDEGESPSRNGLSAADDTDATSLSNGLTSLSLEEGSGPEIELSNGYGEYAAALEGLSLPARVARLKELFPTLNDYSIAHTLGKCEGNWNRAIEELLNHVFFGEAGDTNGEGVVQAKGIDAFTQPNGPHRGRKGKRKKSKRCGDIDPNARSSSMPSGSGSPTNSHWSKNEWQKTSEEIDFIASRTNLPTHAVASVYHKNAGSMAATIVALIDTADEPDVVTAQPNESVLKANAAELARDFPGLPKTQLATLIRLTSPSTAAAHELAKIMAAAKRRPAAVSPEHLVPQYAPLVLPDAPTKEQPSAKRHAAPLSAAPDGPGTRSARDYYAAASSYARKATADNHLAGAAGYYAQLGRDASAASVAAASRSADALAAAQSSPDSLDLHGIMVRDAVRLARGRVAVWWEGLGERRAGVGVDGGWGGRRRGGVGDGFRIVTGKGTHSVGGRGRIGPAVLRALLEDGWKVEVGSGVIYVTGLGTRR